MNITDINFALDMLRHPQGGDKSDIKGAIDIALKSLIAWKEMLEQLESYEIVEDKDVKFTADCPYDIDSSMIQCDEDEESEEE
jgi:hypothetical protein